MCRNIRTLANFEPPATPNEIRASALQFVRKLSGMRRPSRANEAAFNQAVEDVHAAATRLIESLTTAAPPRTREVEALKAKARGVRRAARGDPAPHGLAHASNVDDGRLVRQRLVHGAVAVQAADRLSRNDGRDDGEA